MNLPARRLGGTAVRPWSERSLIFSPDWVLEGDFTLTFFFPAERPLEDAEEVPLRFGEGLLLFLLPGLMEPLFRELDRDLAEPFLVGDGDLDFADWGRESDILPEPVLLGLLLDALVGLGLLDPCRNSNA